MPKKATVPKMTTLPKNAFADFVLDETTGLNRRYADILLYAKDHYPGVFIHKAILYKVANRRAKAPKEDSKELRGVAGVMSRTKKLLAEQPYCELVMQEAGGYRLAVNYEERLVDVLPKAVRHYEIQTERFARVVELQDASKVPDRPELEPYKDQLHKLQILVHKVRSTAFQSALALPVLPPRKAEAE